jgi:glycosyltransferase involved in cell wall biosynthesis
MKIVLIMPSLSGGGAERVFVTLANKFVNLGHFVDLVLLSHSGKYFKELDETVNTVSLNSTRVIFSVLPLTKYLRKLDKKDTFILSTMRHINILAIVAKILSRSDVKLIIREANTYSVATKTTNSVKLRVFDFLAKLLYPLATKIVAPSEGIYNDLIKLNANLNSKINIIYNPIDLPLIHKKSRESISPLFKNIEMPIILAIGSLTPQKNFSFLLKAFSKIAHKIDAVLIILGEGEQRTKLLEMSKSLCIDHKVYLPGFVENPYAFIAKAKLLALSSKYEGLPNVLLQAAALDIPIVSTNCPSGPSEILENGRWGRLVGLSDIEAMASAIEDGCNNKLLPIPAEIVRSQYSIDKIGKKYIDLFQVD